MRSTYVASSMEEARRDAEEGIMSAFIFNDPFRGRQVFTNPGEVLAPEVELDWDFLEPRTLLVGSPENVVERVQELQEVCNLDYLLVEVHPHGASAEQVAEEPGDICRQGYAAIRRRGVKGSRGTAYSQARPAFGGMTVCGVVVAARKGDPHPNLLPSDGRRDNQVARLFSYQPLMPVWGPMGVLVCGCRRPEGGPSS